MAEQSQPDQTERLSVVQQELELLTAPIPEEASGVTLQSDIDSNISFRDEALLQRTLAMGCIASELADPEFADQVAQAIIDHYYQVGNTSPANNIYTYWKLLQETMGVRPDVKAPTAYLGFIQTIAQESGETDIAFETMTLAPDVQLTQETSEELSGLAEVNRASQKSFAVLSELNKRNLSLLHLSERHGAAQDRQLIESYADDLPRLMGSLKAGDIATPEAAAAINTMADTALIDEQYYDQIKLATSLEIGRLLTPEGKAAATARIDELVLNEYFDDPERLVTELDSGLIITAEAQEISKTRIDRLLLEKYGDSAADLGLQFRLKRFKTPEGIAAAQARWTALPKFPDLPPELEERLASRVDVPWL